MKARSVTILSRKGDQPTLEDHVLSNERRGIFAVADGFGGGSLGFDAAKTACAAVGEFLEKEGGDLDATFPFVLRRYYSLAGNLVFNAVWYANEKLVERNDKKAGCEKSGASIVTGFLIGDTLALAGVGGCSAWLVRGGEVARIVQPRTYQRVVDPLERFPEASCPPIPLMALGMSADTEPEISEVKVREGDWVILHSGRLSEELRSKIQGLSTEGFGIDSPEDILRRLKEALEEDVFLVNTSVLVASF